ncbi:MAG: alpha/beta hydrolase domain-containing protein [Vicinamibacterales bacterium]|jgi:pimeloyl-ACP methyl ester carboxylesterase|nr:hypothetical protein [Acidobacteriota bacterium]MDP7294143.1 alpha/beta hydrolase domain-containing protein [Vicinamibacterales bacterium]MDP7672223.1 alpha/beta hydrolase domain-containing protein [Vicinamibacterales bacterium]HJO37644.1 alpha/beta hydrolase domain-containing protein [Vicinamibacterales bacterium]
MVETIRRTVCAGLIASMAGCSSAVPPGAEVMTRDPGSAVEESGLVALTTVDAEKRFVLRRPAERAAWNGRLLVAAHGGSGGPALAADGTQMGTSETSLDDVIGAYAVEHGFAYASVDRDGVGGTREGLAIVVEFAAWARDRAGDLLGRDVEALYLVGLSAGGAIARYAAEDPALPFDGVVIIAGGAGDTATGLDRLARRVALWPAIDPRDHPAVGDDVPAVLAYAAEGAGTPVAARPLWPFIGSSASAAGLERALAGYGVEDLGAAELEGFRVEDQAERPGFIERLRRGDTSGQVLVPTIEVVGTYDDFVLPEILAYKRKVLADAVAGNRHRLYQVRRAWHISREDDALEGFRHRMSRMGIGAEAQTAAGEYGSYVRAVRDALDLINRWVTDGVAAPDDRTVDDGAGIMSGE